MRTPKYRVYVKHWGNSENDGMEYPKKGELHIYFRNWEQNMYESVVFQQFTGLLDKNGKEIYEGDLVKFSEEDKPFGVRYCVDSEGVYYGLIDSENSDTGYSLSTDKDLEVVGNIFETKLDVPQETL
jgi:uncharacterized phage protein (TIGR01671 family)